jgi:DNA-binding response OmpR family regulator
MKPLMGPAARAAIQQLHDNIASMQRGARVLIVDDNRNDCLLLERDLKRVSPAVTVDIASSKEEADKLCLHNCYDIIFLDLVFPGTPGIHLLRDSPCIDNGTAHIIVITGLESDSASVREAMESGARVIFQKPISDKQINLIFGRIP